MKFFALFKSFGIFDTFLYILKRLFERFGKNKIQIYKYLIYAQPISKSTSEEKKSIFSFELLKGYKPIVKSFPRTLETINFRFRQNGRCLVVKKKKEFVGYIWLNEKLYIEDEVRCVYCLHPEDKVCWDYDVYIDPKYRFTTAFKRMWEQAFNYLHKKGITHSLSRIDAFNLNSIRVHEKLGAFYMGVIFFLIIGRLQISVSNFIPRIGIIVSKKKYLNIHINVNRIN